MKTAVSVPNDVFRAAMFALFGVGAALAFWASRTERTLFAVVGVALVPVGVAELGSIVRGVLTLTKNPPA